MRSVLIIVIVLLFSTSEARAQCPSEAPSDEIYLSTTCGGLIACPNAPITLTLEEDRGSCFPPDDCVGYEIQACDTVVWNLGDGTSKTVVGSSSVAHEYLVPGNYSISVTITNSLGTVAVPLGSVVAADSPSRVAFIIPPPSPLFRCTNCTVVRESDGFATLEVQRSLDLSRRVSMDVTGWFYQQNSPGFVENLTFEPGETRKSFSVPIADDDSYYGRRSYLLGFSNFVGGVVPTPGAYGTWLYVLDDEPRPVLSFDGSAISIREGDHGQTEFAIPMTLSAPMQVGVWVDGTFRPGTATVTDFGYGRQLQIAPGELHGTLTGYIQGDTIVEGDETFVIDFDTRNAGNAPSLEHQSVQVTIIDDDHAPNVAEVPGPGIALLGVLVAGLIVIAMRGLR